MQLLQPSRSARKAKRKRLFVIWGALLALAAGGLVAKDPLMRRYRYWKQARALEQARDFVANRDALNAQLALDVALKAVPSDAETIRVAADILEQVGAPQAMRLRRAVTQLLPDSAEDSAKLILSCLRFRDFNAAKDALSGASPALSEQLPMMKAALAYALATADSAVADALLAELRRRLPDDADLVYAQMLLHLRHPDEAKRAEARRQLDEIARTHPERAAQVNRELAGVALQARDYEEARRRFDAVLADPGATLNDRLQKANLALLVDHVPFETVYAELAPLAVKSPADAAQLARWLQVQTRTVEAERLLASLPEEFRKEREVRAVQADLAAQAKDWDRLASMIEAGAWGDIPAESVRLAMSARVVGTQGNTALRLEIWDAAIQAAGPSISALGVLQRLASLWEWSKEAENTLWTLARAFPDQTWAHQALFNLYKEQKNTAGMRNVLVALRQSNGAVPRYQHDWALLSLLRDPSLSWNPAKETMKTLHEQDPGNATYATGYAFALAQSDRFREALTVALTISAEDREFPPRLPYMAYVQAMAGKREEALRLLALAEKAGVDYLPEERKLLSQAGEAAMRQAGSPRPKREEKPAGAPAVSK